MARRHPRQKGGEASEGAYTFWSQRKNTVSLRKAMQPHNSEFTVNFQLAWVDFPVCGLGLCWSVFDVEAALPSATPHFALSGVCWSFCPPSHPPCRFHRVSTIHFWITTLFCVPDYQSWLHCMQHWNPTPKLALRWSGLKIQAFQETWRTIHDF